MHRDRSYCYITVGIEYISVYNLAKKYCLDKVANQNKIWLAITKIDGHYKAINIIIKIGSVVKGGPGRYKDQHTLEARLSKLTGHNLAI